MFEILDNFTPITLEEMDSIRLMNRIDTKFVTNEAMLGRIFSMALEKNYSVFITEGKRTGGYDSLYFDTADLEMYMEHHNTHLVRQKVRTRVYFNSYKTHLEIKQKNNHRRTKKRRISIPYSEFIEFSKDQDATSFLAQNSRYELSDLHPRLNTRFTRVTLVNEARTERLTIDTGLNFYNHDTKLAASLKDAVIIELKQDGNCPSPMKEILFELRVKPFNVSKYCIGNVLTDPNLKNNRFKLKIRRIEKIIDKSLC